MKKQLLLCIVLLFTATINAQLTIVDFEDDGVGKPDTNATAEWTGDPNAPIISLVVNPNASGINTSANVVKYVETTNSNMGQSLQFAFDGTTAKTGHNMASHTFIKLMVYSENKTTFDILLELGTGGTPRFSETKTITTTLNTWTEVIFDFTGNGVSVTPANYALWNTNLRIHFNNGTVGAGDTYYVDNYILDEAEYETVADGDFATAANWLPANVPARAEDKIDIKHNMTYTGNVSVKEMLIRVDKSLNVTGNFSTTNTSNLWAGSSLIVSGTSTGNITSYIPVSDTDWHLISSPVVGEQYNDDNGTSDWVSLNNIDTGTNSNVGIGTYNNGTPDIDTGGGDTATGHWRYFQAGGTATTFGSGTGYQLKRSSGTNYVFTGTHKSDNLLRTINKDVNNWNLVGNPYPSYILVSDVISDNTANLTGTHLFVYVWDNAKTGGAGYKTLAGTDYISPGQAFFVNAANSTANNFTFDKTKLSHQPTATLYRGSSTPAVKLFVKNSNDKLEYTEIEYTSNATTSLDKGLDAGTFTGVATGFSIYSHLVTNSEGVNFMKQSLPNSDLESMVIPIGIKAEAGEITFSAENLNLPEGIKVFIEDRLTNTFTRLDEASANYKVTLTEALNGVGRFYLHTTQSALSVDTTLAINNINIYKANNTTLRIAGLQQGRASVKLFNVLGKQMMNSSFKFNGVKDITLPKLAKGIYIVQLTTEAGKLNKKIILE